MNYTTDPQIPNAQLPKYDNESRKVLRPRDWRVICVMAKPIRHGTECVHLAAVSLSCKCHVETIFSEMAAKIVCQLLCCQQHRKGQTVHKYNRSASRPNSWNFVCDGEISHLILRQIIFAPHFLSAQRILLLFSFWFCNTWIFHVHRHCVVFCWENRGKCSDSFVFKRHPEGRRFLKRLRTNLRNLNFANFPSSILLTSKPISRSQSASVVPLL